MALFDADDEPALGRFDDEWRLLMALLVWQWDRAQALQHRRRYTDDTDCVCVLILFVCGSGLWPQTSKTWLWLGDTRRRSPGYVWRRLLLLSQSHVLLVCARVRNRQTKINSPK